MAALELHVDLAPRRLRLVPAADQPVVDGDQPQADQDDEAEDDPESHAGGLLCRGRQFSHDCGQVGRNNHGSVSAAEGIHARPSNAATARAFAALFTEDGVYHDVFYGAFKGREKIAEMIDDWFHRTARDFRWEMFRPVSDGTMLYAYYTFSYVSTAARGQGQAGRLRRRVDHAARERQDRRVPRGRQFGIGLLDIGFAPERVAKILGKEAKHIKERPEWAAARGLIGKGLSLRSG